ncbi:DNA polymerase III subunit chi [Oceanicoccus sp. KOV_DT_Chl]|uniref:DNA polymerase III subunit chi n=1 Tax=Oceanicoccus sp. KOV_DT_Chl TaxID=1904639 RepID=UPI000C7B5E1F|nr:DNA polymerase III subunit chi [Oceanicoccus sp. KOV_DT_Chl]
MTKVDFYILSADDIEQRHLFACRLVEKAFKLGHQIYVHTDDNAQANALDQLLWSWRSSSFIPHGLKQANSESPTPQSIQIGFGDADQSAAQHNDLLINLSNDVPEFFSRFDRVAEIVVQTPAITEATRNSFRFYRNRGYQLESHDLRPTH